MKLKRRTGTGSAKSASLETNVCMNRPASFSAKNIQGELDFALLLARLNAYAHVRASPLAQTIHRKTSISHSGSTF
jgi:hypothetical protein